MRDRLATTASESERDGLGDGWKPCVNPSAEAAANVANVGVPEELEVRETKIPTDADRAVDQHWGVEVLWQLADAPIELGEWDVHGELDMASAELVHAAHIKHERLNLLNEIEGSVGGNLQSRSLAGFADESRHRFTCGVMARLRDGAGGDEESDQAEGESFHHVLL